MASNIYFDLFSKTSRQGKGTKCLHVTRLLLLPSADQTLECMGMLFWQGRLEILYVMKACAFSVRTEEYKRLLKTSTGLIPQTDLSVGVLAVLG